MLAQNLLSPASNASSLIFKRGFASFVTSSTTSNGIRVVSVNNGSPITSVRLVVEAGTRHETAKGTANVVRNLAFLGTPEHNQVIAARELELVNFSTATTREYTSYNAQLKREQDLGEYLKNLGNTISAQPAYWRVKEAKNRVISSLGEVNNVDTYLDVAHRVAYRHSNLGNPLVLHNSSSLNTSHEQVKNFIGERFNTGSTFVVAAGGLSHQDVVSAVESGLSSLPSGAKATTSSSTYAGGESTFSGSGPAHVILAVEGASLKAQSDVLSLQLLQQLLGSGKGRNDASEITNQHSALNRNVIAKHGFARYARAFNFSYTDSGIFGIYAVADVDAADSIAKVLSEQLNGLPSLVNDTDAFNRAKRQLLISLLSNLETTESTARLLVQHTLADNISGTNLEAEYTKAVESLTAAGVKKVAESLVSKPLTLVGAGDVTLFPSVRQLKA